MNEPIIPGEILLEEYLKPMGISQNAMARAIGVAPRAINEIVHGRRSITPAMHDSLWRLLRSVRPILAWNPGGVRLSQARKGQASAYRRYPTGCDTGSSLLTCSYLRIYLGRLMKPLSLKASPMQYRKDLPNQRLERLGFTHHSVA